MFNSNEINTIQCCISNYIACAENQLDSLTIGVNGCNELADIYQTRINDCYEIQKRLQNNSFSEITIPVKQEIRFTPEDAQSLKKLVDIIFSTSNK